MCTSRAASFTTVGEMGNATSQYVYEQLPASYGPLFRGAMPTYTENDGYRVLKQFRKKQFVWFALEAKVAAAYARRGGAVAEFRTNRPLQLLSLHSALNVRLLLEETRLDKPELYEMMERALRVSDDSDLVTRTSEMWADVELAHFFCEHEFDGYIFRDHHQQNFHDEIMLCSASERVEFVRFEKEEKPTVTEQKARLLSS